MNEKEINLDQMSMSQKVRFCGKSYELGYIPCGVAIPLLNEFNAILKGEHDGTLKPAEASERTIQMLLTFCNRQHKLSRKRLSKASSLAVDGFITLLIKLLMGEQMGSANTGSAKPKGKKKA